MSKVAAEEVIQTLLRDFQYNVKLIEERDSELREYDTLMERIEITIVEREKLIFQLNNQLQELRKICGGLDVKNRQLLDEVELSKAQCRSLAGQLKEKDAQLEQANRLYQLKMASVKESMELQRREFMDELEEALSDETAKFESKLKELESRTSDISKARDFAMKRSEESEVRYQAQASELQELKLASKEMEAKLVHQVDYQSRIIHHQQNRIKHLQIQLITQQQQQPQQKQQKQQHLSQILSSPSSNSPQSPTLALSHSVKIGGNSSNQPSAFTNRGENFALKSPTVFPSGRGINSFRLASPIGAISTSERKIGAGNNNYLPENQSTEPSLRSFNIDIDKDNNNFREDRIGRDTHTSISEVSASAFHTSVATRTIRSLSSPTRISGSFHRPSGAQLRSEDKSLEEDAQLDAQLSAESEVEQLHALVMTINDELTEAKDLNERLHLSLIQKEKSEREYCDRIQKLERKLIEQLLSENEAVSYQSSSSSSNGTKVPNPGNNFSLSRSDSLLIDSSDISSNFHSIAFDALNVDHEHSTSRIYNCNFRSHSAISPIRLPRSSANVSSPLSQLNKRLSHNNYSVESLLSPPLPIVSTQQQD